MNSRNNDRRIRSLGLSFYRHTSLWGSLTRPSPTAQGYTLSLPSSLPDTDAQHSPVHSTHINEPQRPDLTGLGRPFTLPKHTQGEHARSPFYTTAELSSCDWPSNASRPHGGGTPPFRFNSCGMSRMDSRTSTSTRSTRTVRRKNNGPVQHRQRGGGKRSTSLCLEPGKGRMPIWRYNRDSVPHEASWD